MGIFFIFLFTGNIFSQIPYDKFKDDISTLISPDAIKLDIDRFLFITHGLVAVQKGDKQALIDVKGNFIIPWGKYTYSDCGPILWQNLIRVSDANNIVSGGFIDLQGKVIIPIKDRYMYGCFNYFGISKLGSQSLDNKGNVLQEKTFFASSGEFPGRELYTKKQATNRILIIKEVDETEIRGPKDYTPKNNTPGHYAKTKDGNLAFTYKKKKYFYGNKLGQVLLSVNYDVARDFTDGRAAVMKTDEFGVGKWGFIDTLGKLVIPLIFTKEPGYFHDGLALVDPTDKTEFQYAYIDKTGQIKIKIGSPDKKDYYTPLTSDGKKGLKYVTPTLWIPDIPTVSYFINGYSLWSRNGYLTLLDTTGRFFTPTEFIKNIQSDLPQKLIFQSISELGVYYSFNINTIGYGLVDFTGNILFPFTGGQYNPDYYSPYALGEVSNDIQKKPQYGYKLEGVVNSQGKFILIKEAKGTW